MAMRPLAPSKVVPMPTKDNEGHIEAKRWSLVSQRDCQSQHKRQLQLYCGSGDALKVWMLAPPRALGSFGSLNSGDKEKEGVNTWGQGQESIACSTIKKSKGRGKKKSKKEKDAKNGEEGKEKESRKKKTSSFEVGALASSPGMPLPVASKFLGASSGANANANVNAKTLAQKSNGMFLGLGLLSTSTIWLPSSPSMHVGSSASSDGPSAPGLVLSPIVVSAVMPNLNNPNANTIADNRVSIESAFYATGRPCSVLSSSSLRPLSTTSTNSRMSQVSNSGNQGHSALGASVRRDEQGLETVREMRGREREGRKKEVGAGGDGGDKESEKERGGLREKRRSNEGSGACWMGVGAGEEARDDAGEEEEETMYRKQQKEKDSPSIKRFLYSILTIEEATARMGMEYGRPDDWDDIIAGYESGSADMSSKEMAGGAAEEFWFKEKADGPLLPQMLLSSQCVALISLKSCISTSSTSNCVGVVDKMVDLFSNPRPCLPQPHHRPGSLFMFTFIPPSPPSNTAEKEGKLDTWVGDAERAGAREIIGYVRALRVVDALYVEGSP
ncbi:hypothetical protein CVT25_012523 [Psilocybe cyanescens]|uniref:Uncharacterized protein n=1 Tax=Psilocybe cyanescens TaxID=93625 RepID=A0A409X7Z5_PSICY|nr:hypothetical protein CVT25_012523 [Psilocybe cyanescens]